MSISRAKGLSSLQLKRFIFDLYSFFLSSYVDILIFYLTTVIAVHCDRFADWRQRSDRFPLL
jgi:hypothetical protein